MLSNKLKQEGYAVALAVDGEEGLLKLRSERPDLVLLDIVMPKISGMEVLETMHSDEIMRQVPVIIISNSGQPVEIEKAKALGIKDYLVKAEFDPEEVVEKVKNVLKENSFARSPDVRIIKEKVTTNKGKENMQENNPAKQTAPLEKSKVLVVEDDQFLRDLIVRKLNEEGLDTIQAIDGEEGLRLTREKKPAIVLLDIILPGIDGFEVLRQMKADPSINNIPVVMLSNLGQKDDIDHGLKLGAVDYLIKAHFTPGEIVEKVKEVLKSQQ